MPKTTFEVLINNRIDEILSAPTSLWGRRKTPKKIGEINAALKEVSGQLAIAAIAGSERILLMLDLCNREPNLFASGTELADFVAKSDVVGEAFFELQKSGRIAESETLVAIGYFNLPTFAANPFLSTLLCPIGQGAHEDDLDQSTVELDQQIATDILDAFARDRSAKRAYELNPDRQDIEIAMEMMQIRVGPGKLSDRIDAVLGRFNPLAPPAIEPPSR